MRTQWLLPLLAALVGTLADRSDQSDRYARLSRDPSVVRLYTFDDARAGAPIANRAGPSGELTWSLTPVPNAAEETFTIVEGMKPRSKAIRLDRGVLSGDPVHFTGKAFAVEMWFRKHGYGALRGNADATNGTLVSVGNGYWNGWRVTTSYPEQTFGFEIGRPAPLGSAGFFLCGPLPDSVWHHLAATWDGREMRLYLNGALAGAMPYDGEMLPGDKLRIGYADAGWGSVKLDVDTVVVYDRSIGTAEALAMAMPDVELNPAMLERWIEAETARASGLYARAAASYQALAAQRGIHPDLLAMAQLRLAEVRRQWGRAGEGVELLAGLVADSSVAARFRKTALTLLMSGDQVAEGSLSPGLLRTLLSGSAAPEPTGSLNLSEADKRKLRHALARSLMASSATEEARKEYRRLIEQTEDRSEVLRLRLEMAHALRASGKWAEARRAYTEIAGEESATPAMRSTARLLAARTLMEQRRLKDAAAAFRRVAAASDALLSEQYEAREALDEIARLTRGQPAFDPNASRARIPPMPRPGVELFVSPSGSDSAPGTKAQPLRSMHGAVERIRQIRRGGSLPKGGVAVTFAAGRYPVSQCVELTREDSGAAGAPILFRAAAGADVRFLGGRRLTEFRAVTDPALLERIPEQARPHVLQADLRANGVQDPGTLAPRGVGFSPTPVPELFWNGRPLKLARWPNDGWAQTGAIIEPSNASGGFTFAYSEARMSRWTEERDAWLFGYWGYLWADHGVRAAAFDAQQGRIATAHRPGYAAQTGMPWFIYNALSELDSPGEWYLDAERGLLIVYPPSDISKAIVEYSELAAPFVKLDDVSHVRFERLGFELGRANGIEISGGSHVLVAGCRIGKLRGSAVVVDGGSHHGVFGCELYTLGRNGTSIKGGDRRTLTPSGHFVENCRIHDFSRWDRTYTPAVYAEGVAIRIAHNLIHDSPGHAMRIEGNDHVIEFNEVHHVVTETDDQGALDMWFNPTYRGVVIRHNFWHHIGSGRDERMRGGVRLDDAISGVLIYGNVFWKASEGFFGGVQIHGGKENEVVNNVFVDCKFGVSFSQWGPQRWKQYTESEPFRKATMQDVDITRPPYSVRYPALAALAERPDRNVIARNLAVHVSALLTRDGGTQDVADNLIAVRDPGFADADRGRFLLKPGSAVFGQTGMRPIPFDAIGRYAHPLAVGAPGSRTQ